MYSLGIDIGSSSVKVSILNIEKGSCECSAFSPKSEMLITAKQKGWAEQDPELWWENFKHALREILNDQPSLGKDIKSIGISYQMHGLVVLDKTGKALRPSIIWCDSRAVSYGEKAFEEIGKEKALGHLLNSPGNFTASKLKWVKENEPEIYSKIDKIMLPGDYISYRLSGKINTTISGLSEGILWDFKNEEIANLVLENYGIEKNLIPETHKTFENHGNVSKEVADDLGLLAGTTITYKSGDQPNNAFSLNVLKLGEIAATAGTSGVVYGVSDQLQYDIKSRVNTFAHVNHTKENRRLGILLCINGTGILNSWLNKNVATGISYNEMNDLAAKIEVGSEGLCVYPFGNGAERVLENKDMGASVKFLNFNIHNKNHLLRAAQEGIAFSFFYGIEIMREMGINIKVIKAGKANMFLSPIFRQTLSNITNCKIELYNTDGALGAARGGAFGSGLYSTLEESMKSLEKIEEVNPQESLTAKTMETYLNWKKNL